MFQGPKGHAELYEDVDHDREYPLLEIVNYEVLYEGTWYPCLTMGDGAITACDFVGDDRYLQPVMSTKNSPGIYRTLIRD